MDFGIRVSGSGYRDSSFGFRISGFEFLVQDFEFRVQDFGILYFRGQDFGFRGHQARAPWRGRSRTPQEPGFGFRVLVFGIRDSGSVFRVPRSGSQPCVSGFGFMVHGVGSRVTTFFRVSGFGFRVPGIVLRVQCFRSRGSDFGKTSPIVTGRVVISVSSSSLHSHVILEWCNEKISYLLLPRGSYIKSLQLLTKAFNYFQKLAKSTINLGLPKVLSKGLPKLLSKLLSPSAACGHGGSSFQFQGFMFRVQGSGFTVRGVESRKTVKGFRQNRCRANIANRRQSRRWFVEKNFEVVSPGLGSGPPRWRRGGW